MCAALGEVGSSERPRFEIAFGRDGQMRESWRGGAVVGVLASFVVGCGGSAASPAKPDATITAAAPSVASSETPASAALTTANDPPSTIAATSTTAGAADSTAAKEPPTDPPVTSVPASTAAAETRPFNPDDQAAATAATLQAVDFPATWVVYAAGSPGTIGEGSCSYRPDGAVTLLTNGAVQDGPTMQLGDSGAFVSSFGVAFPEEHLAVDYISVVNTAEWASCRVTALQQFQQDNGSDSVVELTSRTTPSLNQGGLESYAEFDLKSTDGTLQRVVQQSFYRLGRIVIGSTSEYGPLSEIQSDQVSADPFAALSKAYERVTNLR